MIFRIAATVPLVLADCATLPDLPETAALIEPAVSLQTAPPPTHAIVTQQSRRIEAPADWRSLASARTRRRRSRSSPTP